MFSIIVISDWELNYWLAVLVLSYVLADDCCFLH